MVDKKKLRRRPSKVELGETELAIQWMDGEHSRFSLADLRGSCPCAVCCQARGQSEQEMQLPGGELPVLTGGAATATASAREFIYVGRYGIRIEWADGHNTGIYTFESLRIQADG
ncbi:MAG TPA: DUF971 domain-containing protein [Candidatus Latescibacteria bacterium]|nr:DUF971 domain-containing protein [Candidatus Latescibacterota bacterium]